MPKKPNPLATFRVYPEGRFLYAEVNIWPNKTAMYRYNPLNRNHSASCKGTVVYNVPSKKSGKPVRRDGIFAELNFHRNAIGVEVVAHEMTHATFCWAERVKLPLEKITDEQNWKTGRKKAQALKTDGPEERFCYALGIMTRQFTQKCYDLGFYKEVVQS